ncbi:hypothetical protein D0Z06_13220 [Geodermatophilus marinus]|nr:hypothetical protein D0Z06_13220 [Geodermatophilus sp. LHW52908]
MLWGMFPRTEVSGTVQLPAAATYWMPKRSEIDEEGIGFFRDVWTITDVPFGEARSMVREERRLATAVADLAETPEDFDRIAHVVETGLDGDREDVGPAERAVLEPVVSEEPPLDGLELGIAGLVYALAAVGMVPAASCRGHCDERAWSDHPVVLFAATRYRAQALAGLIEPTGCRFDIDPARPDLLLVAGRSIGDTMSLAEAILAARQTFIQSRPARSRGRTAPAVQDPLF